MLRQKPGYFFDAEVAGILESGLGVFERQCCERLLRDYAREFILTDVSAAIESSHRR
jgi:hypothetical protein